MDVKQIRLERFRALWNDKYGGNIAKMARAIDVSANQVRFYLNPDKPGGRFMGEDFARDIERILELGRGYLDREADDATALHPDDQRFIRLVTEAVLTREVPQHVRDAILTLLGSSPVKSQDGPQQMAA